LLSHFGFSHHPSLPRMALAKRIHSPTEQRTPPEESDVVYGTRDIAKLCAWLSKGYSRQFGVRFPASESVWIQDVYCAFA
jgi:hypothetical protein